MQASRSPIFSKEKSKLVRDSIRTACGAISENSFRQRFEFRAVKDFEPLLVRPLFVAAFPIEISLVAKAAF